MAVKKYRPSTFQRVTTTEYNLLVALVNSVKAKHNAVLTKLDADAGVTDTNYSALHAVALADGNTLQKTY